MPQTFNRKNEISDVVKWETDPRYCRDFMEVDNTDGTDDIEFKVGECYNKETGTILTGSEPATPAVTTITLVKSGDSTADNTLIVGGVTFTAKAGGEAPLPIRAAARLTLTAPVGRLVYDASPTD